MKLTVNSIWNYFSCIRYYCSDITFDNDSILTCIIKTNEALVYDFIIYFQLHQIPIDKTQCKLQSGNNYIVTHYIVSLASYRTNPYLCLLIMPCYNVFVRSWFCIILCSIKKKKKKTPHHLNNSIIAHIPFWSLHNVIIEFNITLFKWITIDSITVIYFQDVLFQYLTHYLY